MPAMQQEKYTQERLIGDSPDETVAIETEGRVIRPALGIPDALVDECRVHAGPDGLSIQAIDPANVAMTSITVHADAFDGYDAPDEFVTGVNLGTLQSQLRGARMGRSTSDPVALDIDTTRTRLRIEREYDLATVTRTDAFLNIDPDSVREEPDLPELEYECEATIDTAAFVDAVAHIDAIGDHMAVRHEDGNLHIDESIGNDDEVERAGRVEIPDVVTSDDGEPTGSAFSLDYLKDIADALDTALVDEVTLQFGEEIPVRIAFERTDDKTVLYEGAFLQAPRIQK